MQNICKSVHFDFNETSMSRDELEDDLKDIFGFDEFDFPDYKKDSVESNKPPLKMVDIKIEQKVDIHIGERSLQKIQLKSQARIEVLSAL